MNITAKLKWSILNAGGINLICLLSSFIGGVFLSRTLGAEGKGTLAIYLNLYNLILLVSSLGIRQKSSFLFSREGWSFFEIVKCQNKIFIYSMLLAGISLTAYGLASNFGVNRNTVVVFFMIMASLYVNYRTFIALSLKNIRLLNELKLLQTVLPYIIYVFLTYFIGYEFEVYLISNLIAYTIASLYVYRKSQLYVQTEILNKKKGIAISEMLKGGIKYALPLFLFNLNFKIDQFFIVGMMTNKDVGIYSISASLSELIWQLPSVLTIFILSYGFNTKDDHKFSLMISSKAKSLMLILLPICIFYAFLMRDLVGYIYGSQFNAAGALLAYLMPGTYVMVLFHILNSDAASKGKPHLSLVPLILSLIINILANSLLIPSHGLIGAAIASSISYVVATIIYVVIYRVNILRKI